MEETDQEKFKKEIKEIREIVKGHHEDDVKKIFELVNEDIIADYS